MREIRSAALRYGLALGAFVSIVSLSFGLERLFSIKLQSTFLLIAAMIACAWYLGRGPGLLIAVALELTLDYYSYYYSPVPWSAVATFNRMILFVSLVLFVSSRRNAEKLLREQREWLQVTLSSIGDAVIATDVNGIINFINPTAEAITGWTLEQAAKRPLDEVFRIINEETRATVESPFSVIKRKGIIVGLANHTLLIAKDGTEIPIEDSGAPIKDARGQIIGVIVVFHNVSERRRAEHEREQILKREQSARSEAEAANRLKDEFLATVSHELRTPLTAIMGYAEMMHDDQLNQDETDHAVEIITRNARSQAKIIDEILDVSRIITGKFHLEMRPVQLAPLIQAALDTLHPAAAAKAITITVALDNEAGLVAGDANRLQQVIWNLVSNAIKFTPQKGRVEIRLERVEAHLEVRVSDDGVGINEQFVPYLFERFRQADSSTTRAHGGLGLGLAIVRHLVELHGGTVRAESAGAGRGAVFTVRLPLAAAREEQALDSTMELNQMTEKGDSLGQTPNLMGLRVLVVDDEPDTLEIVSVMLKQYGAQVRVTASTAAALEALIEWTPDVLISDLGMPDEDGFALIGQVRTLTPEQGGNIPAAALTAYVSDDDSLRALAAGYHTHIAKPVEPITLAAAVADLAKRGERN